MNGHGAGVEQRAGGREGGLVGKTGVAGGSGVGERERGRGGAGGERSTCTGTSEAAGEEGCQGVAAGEVGAAGVEGERVYSRS